MTRARNSLIDLDSTSYYHCISRCVRRAFLWGEDHLTGKNYGHRKSWVIERLAELSNIFAIEVCAYAVMSNHYHVVLRVNQQTAKDWSNQEVIARWKKLFSLPLLVQRWQDEKISSAEAEVAEKIIAEWRERLISISWFMKSLNEDLARQANKEDNCKGRFWEGRFKSQALLDEAAVLMCMSYVDLNPIRAGISDLPESSDFTSIQQRIQEIHQSNSSDSPTRQNESAEKKSVPLLAFSLRPLNHIHDFSFSAVDYIELVDWAGRIIREDKRGVISGSTPPILDRLNINPQQYIKMLQHKKTKLSLPVAIGSIHTIQQFAEKTRRKFIRYLNFVKPIIS